RRQGGRARLLRRPGDARDAGQGRPEGRQSAAAGEAPSVGRSRSDGLSVPATAASTTGAARATTVTRDDVCARRRPAASGPSGVTATRSVFEADIARPSRRSGISVYEYAATAESVFGKQKAWSANAPAST